MDDIDPLKLEEFREAFRIFDKDKDGQITTMELQVCMQSLGLALTEAQLEALIAEVDVDLSGTVGLEEFVNLMMRTLTSVDLEEDISEAFKIFDRDGNGLVSIAELKQVLCHMGNNLREEEMTDILNEANVDKDGMVLYKEFVDIMMARP